MTIYIDSPQSLDQLINGIGPGGGIVDSSAVELSPAMGALSDTYSKGVALSSAGELDEANELYVELLDQYPAFVAARFNLATNLRLLGDLEAAKSHIDIALRYGSRDHTALTLAGLIYGELGDQLTEVDMYQRAHHAAPHSTDPLFYLVITYRQLGWWTVARGWLEVLDSLIRPTIRAPVLSAQAHDVARLEWNWGLVHEHFGKWELAAERFEAAYRFSPEEAVLTKARTARRRALESTSR